MKSRQNLVVILITLSISVFGQDPPAALTSHPGFSERKAERERMVRDHIRNYPNNPVKDVKVLKAMRRVPRHLFVPAEYRDMAYRNSPLPIGYEQTISQPVLVAHMTELLDIQPGDKILEIGTGSGYQAAVLGELAQQVYTMEIVAPLGKQAKKLVHDLGYKQVHVQIGNGYLGWPEEAPFHKIIVTCAPDQIPQALLDQLLPGGKMIIPVGGRFETQYMVEVKKNSKGKLFKKEHYPVRFVPMTGRKNR